jgi:hypothetical protein
MLDRIHDPSASIDLCGCGVVLGPLDGDQCEECRMEEARVVYVPNFALISWLILCLIGSTVFAVIGWKLWFVVRG